MCRHITCVLRVLVMFAGGRCKAAMLSACPSYVAKPAWCIKVLRVLLGVARAGCSSRHLLDRLAPDAHNGTSSQAGTLLGTSSLCVSPTACRQCVSSAVSRPWFMLESLESCAVVGWVFLRVVLQGHKVLPAKCSERVC